MALFRRRTDDNDSEPTTAAVPLGSLPLRTLVVVCGQVTQIRTRPSQGLPALVVTVSDSTGHVTAVWTGRRSVGGITLGRTVCLEGVFTKTAGEPSVLNPAYTLR